MRQDQDSFAYGQNACITWYESLSGLSVKPRQPNTHHLNHPLINLTQLPLLHVPINQHEKSPLTNKLQPQSVVKSQLRGQVI